MPQQLKTEDSAMSEAHIFDQIRQLFSFDILQPAGGKFKNLVIPSLSASYSWTASAAAGSSKSPIYILAKSDIKVIISAFLCSRSQIMLLI